MTHCERIEIIRDKICRIGDVALGVDVTWLCDYALSLMTVNGEYWSAIYGDLYRDALEKLETERVVISNVKEFAEEKITALEKERDELRERLNERSQLAVEVFHEEDRDGPHVLAEAYLMYHCVKCSEALCPDGSDEPLDGLVCDIDGYTIQCRKCGAEYIGYKIDTPKLALIQETQDDD